MSTIADLSCPEKLMLRILPKNALDPDGRKIRVCMVVDSFDAGTKGDGGAERQLLALMPSLVEKNCDVFVVTRRVGNDKRVERTDDFVVHRLAAGNRLIFCASIFFFLIKYRRSFDLLHVHTPNLAAFVGSLVCWLSRKPVLVKNRGVDEFKCVQESFWGRLRMRLMAAWNTNWIALNSEGEELLGDLGFSANRIYQACNGVDISFYRPFTFLEKEKMRAELNISNSSFVVAFVGRLIKRKQVDILIHAWAEVCNQLSNATLLLIGDGPERPVLENIVHSSGVEGSVRFVGKVPSAHVVSYLQCADVFVLPSYAEGMSNAILEAMSVGLPVIATSVGSARDMLDHNRQGLLINSNEKLQAELKEALLLLSKDESARHEFGLAARKKIKNQYAIEKIAANYRNLYCRLLDQNE